MRLSQLFSLAVLSATAIAQIGGGGGSRPLNVVDSATYEPRRPLAPGTLATVFGEFPGATQASAGGQIVTTLGNLRVMVGGMPVPLLYTSPEQINLVLPQSLPPGDHEMVVTVNGSRAGSASITLEATAPAIFMQTRDGARSPVILNADGTANSASNPAARRSTVFVYATGLGAAPEIRSTGAMIGLNRVDASATEARTPAVWVVSVPVPNDDNLTGATPMAIYAGTGASNTVAVWVQ